MTNGVAGKGHVVLSEDTPRFPRAATKLKLDPVLMEHTGVYGKLGTQRVVLISIFTLPGSQPNQRFFVFNRASWIRETVGSVTSVIFALLGGD